jgi:histidinol-phosphate aminotransferase
MILLTSPGNPTSTLVPPSVVKELLDSPSFKGLVVIDEAYIDFVIPSSPNEPVSAASLIDEYPNLVILQTLSKGFGLAAIRLGLGLASPELVQILSNTKAPYNVSAPTAALALHALAPESLVAMRSKVQQLIQGRQWLVAALEEFRRQGDLGHRVGGLDGNFVLFPVLKRGTGEPDNVRAEKVYQKLAETEGVVVRFRGREHGCEGCLRITVGTDEENRICVEKLRKVLEETD